MQGARLTRIALTTGAALLFAPTVRAVVIERVIAVIGEKPILMSELKQRARPFLVQLRQKVPPGAQQAAAESQLLKDLVQKMVDEELELQGAEKSHIRVTADEVDSALKNLAANQGTTVEELVNVARQESGLTEQEYRDELRRQILEGKMLELRVKGHVRVTQEDVAAMFDRTMREERRQREYHSAWIVLRLLPGASAEAVVERKQLAEAIVARAKKGEDFSDLARRYSDDSATRDLGGDLGVRAPNGSQAALVGRRPILSAEFESAVMPLEPGDVSDALVTHDAILIFKVLDRQPSRFTTLDASKGEMLQRLQAEILTKAKRRWLDELKRKTHVDVRL